MNRQRVLSNLKKCFIMILRRKAQEKEKHMRKLALKDEILLSIQQPARYIGGEVNMCMKNKEDIQIRFCMCFPDVYEIGMSHLGIQILSTD